MNQKWIVGGIVILAVLALGYFVWPGEITKNQHTEKEKITIAEFGEVFLYAPLYVAYEKDFFGEEGLEVTITPTGGDDKTFAALLSGDAQFGVADPTFAAISGEQGQPGRVIAAMLEGVPFWGITDNENIPEIEKPEDLNGFTVATFPAPSTAFTLQKNMFESGDLQPQITETAFGSLLAAVEAGSADIALELEPNVSTAVNQDYRIVYSIADQYPNFALTSLTALPEYLESNPETAQKVVNSLQKAMDFIHSNPEETAKLLVNRFTDVEPDIAESAIRNMIDAKVYPKTVIPSEAGWEAAINLRQQIGDLKEDAPYETYVVTSFARKAR